MILTNKEGTLVIIESWILKELSYQIRSMRQLQTENGSLVLKVL
jgi:ribosomal protein S6